MAGSSTALRKRREGQRFGSCGLATLDEVDSSDGSAGGDFEKRQRSRAEAPDPWRPSPKGDPLFAASAIVAAIAAGLCSFFGVRITAFIWVGLELASLLLWKIRERKGQPVAGFDGQEMFRRFLRVCAMRDEAGAPLFDAENCIRQWVRSSPSNRLAPYVRVQFRGVALDEVRRDNVRELLCHGFFQKNRLQMIEAGMVDVPEKMVRQLQASTGLRFREGYNPNVGFVSELWRDPDRRFRPLCCSLVSMLTTAMRTNTGRAFEDCSSDRRRKGVAVEEIYAEMVSERRKIQEELKAL